MKLTKKQMIQIKKFALNYYKGLDKTHNIWHASETVRLAKYIARKEKASMQISELGALLHQFHPEHIKAVEKFLKKIKVDKNIANQLLHCVYCVDRKTVHEAKTLEAKIVFDADKLQTIGPFGLLREAAYLAEITNMEFVKIIPLIKEIQKDCYRKLQTMTAKKMARKPYKLAIECLEGIAL
jgi:HD superfamily phosphodiesterase